MRIEEHEIYITKNQMNLKVYSLYQIPSYHFLTFLSVEAFLVKIRIAHNK